MDVDSFLIENVFTRLATKEKRAGKASLSVEERTIVNVWHAKGLIGNGGFEYLLTWEDADDSMANMFASIGANEISEVIRKLFLVFKGVDSLSSATEKEKFISKLAKSSKAELVLMEGEYHNHKETIPAQLADHIKTNWDSIEDSIYDYWVFWENN